MSCCWSRDKLCQIRIISLGNLFHYIILNFVYITAPSGKDVAVRYKREGSGVERIEYTPKEVGKDDLIVYAHGRRLCSNWVRHGSTTIGYQQCNLNFMRERYLHRSFAYAKSAVSIDVVSVHKLLAYRVMSTVSTDIVSSHKKYCRIAYGITR